MNPGHRQWVFVLLWVNVAVTVVVLTQVSVGNIAGFREIIEVLGYSLVYANVSGILAIAFVAISTSARGPRIRMRVPALLLCVVLLSGLGCLLAQVLLMATGIVVPARFWPNYFHTLRVAIPIALVSGGAALAHAAMRDRAQAAQNELREKELSENRIRALLAQARLQALESRIHPHFLFNTLNSISALIAVDPARAEQVVEKLAVLLRASLDTASQPLIPLRQELAIVASYLEIQQIRFGSELHASVQVPQELLGAMVPPMSVQALVENACKYGIASQGDHGKVWVSASAEKQTLRIEIRDSGPGFDLKAVPAGRGLDNLVERLEALFGPSAYLNVCRREGQCVAELVLPLP